jgi:hypothetical protein
LSPRTTDPWAAHVYRLLGYRTIEELFADCKAGVRRSIPRRDMLRAWQLERALLPASTRFPREGEVWEAIDDVEVRYTVFADTAPHGADGRAVLRKGERVICRSASPPQLLSGFEPVGHAEFHERIVAQGSFAHTGTYHLSIWTAQLNADFRPIDS